MTGRAGGRSSPPARACSGASSSRPSSGSTPEYSGPFAAGPLNAGTRAAFSKALSSWCELNSVVTEFGHLHPWKARTELLDPAGLELDREIVYVDLTLDEDRLWRGGVPHPRRQNN